MARLPRTRHEDQRDLGKLIGLLRLLGEHGDAIEADLQRYYQLDLCDLYRGTLSLRRIGVLVRQLPGESALVRSIYGPGYSPVDLLADLWTVTVQAHSETGSLPDDFDHPVRAKMTAEAKAEHMRSLKEKYLRRKRGRAAARNQS
ncbi:hypothetical protein [Mycolicibacterium fortuitum]|uniref:hypothetical protein n=1 Tax=Mycolicibacterium fortuitum TaxID=1766 RepID=UPI001042815E|nr:hypothetical protein [Mycolicibacterium fortuitum]